MPLGPALLTIALAVACGQPAEGPASGRPTAPVVGQPVPTPNAAAVDSAPILVAVELPAAFPAEFPIAPESTVIEANSRRGSTGVLSYVTILARGEPGDILAWYRTALENAGWMMASENEPGNLTLRATHGESYVELTTVLETGPGGGEWARTRATIWKTEH